MSRIVRSRIIVWDVGHGSSISIMAPNGRTAMIDLGANVDTDFSPIKFTKKMWNITNLDDVIVSHPHVDHIRDIVNLDLLRPKVFTGSAIPREKLITSETREEDKIVLETYLEFKAGYKEQVSPEKQSSIDSWGNPGALKTYWATADWEKEPNNTSIVTFFKMEAFTLFYPGDIESGGWSELLKNSDFVSDLKTTCVFIASHHGRKAGFSQDVVKMADPSLVVISDSHFKDTSATSEYSNLARGFNITDENNDKVETRKVISTRADGRVIMDISYDGKETSADIRVKLSSS